jgi:DNA-binding transcriptional ArsR family regulator
VQSLNVLGDPTRRQIVEILAGGALRAGDIASRFEMSAPAVSQHLKVLREANLVSVRRDAQRRIYELNPTGVGELAAWVERLRGFWSQKLDALENAMIKSEEEVRSEHAGRVRKGRDRAIRAHPARTNRARVGVSDQD